MPTYDLNDGNYDGGWKSFIDVDGNTCSVHTYNGGDKTYRLNPETSNVLHRIDGPALDWKGNPGWYLHGKSIPVKTQEEFERYLRLKAFW